jgi:hypothetical protein
MTVVRTPGTSAVAVAVAVDTESADEVDQPLSTLRPSRR